MTIPAAVLGGVDPFGTVDRVVLPVVATGRNLSHWNQQLTLAIGGVTLLAVGAWRERRARRRSRRRG